MTNINSSKNIQQNNKSYISPKKKRPFKKNIDNIPEDKVEISSNKKNLSSKEAIDIALDGGPKAVKITRLIREGLKEAGKIGSQNSMTDTALSSLNNAFTGPVAVHYTKKGVKGIKEGIKEKDLAKSMKGTGNTLKGIKNGISFSQIATSQGTGAIAKALNSPAMSIIGQGLTATYSALKIGAGAINMYKGIKSNDIKKSKLGSMEIGIGVSTIAIALGAGIPGAVGLGAAYIAKMAIKYGYKLKDNKLKFNPPKQENQTNKNNENIQKIIPQKKNDDFKIHIEPPEKIPEVSRKYIEAIEEHFHN